MRLAARGQRDLDGGEELVDDPLLAVQLHRQAREVQVEAVLIAGALTGLALLVPG